MLVTIKFRTNMYKILVACLLTIGTNEFAFAQPPRGILVRSPEVLPDKKVTFRYLAPQAKEVRLGGQSIRRS